MKQRYLTIKDESETRFEIEKSLFISRIARVDLEDDAAAFINSVKRIEKDATHNCSAYLVGENGRFQKADDDGEPSGTAGRPILDVIKRSGLTDCVIVVTRYFGGIKLGAGGLIRAYSSAAKLVIESASVVERVPYSTFRFSIDYPRLKSIETGFERGGFIILQREYSLHIDISAAVRCADEKRFLHFISETTSGKVLPEKTGEILIDTPETSGG